jgi:hypothetical protein
MGFLQRKGITHTFKQYQGSERLLKMKTVRNMKEYHILCAY